jgi:hypothetical protein
LYSIISTQNSGNSTILYQGCTSTYPLASGATVVEQRVGQADLTTTAITGPVEMWAEPIYVEFRQQDLTLYSTSSPTTTNTSTPAQPSSTASSATSAPTSSPSSGSDPYHSKGGLSTGAKAGIGVGAGLGTLLILLAVLFFAMRRRRKIKQRRRPESYYQPGFYNQSSEMDGSQLPGKSLPNEMDASEGKYSRSRKPIGQARVELES